MCHSRTSEASELAQHTPGEPTSGHRGRLAGSDLRREDARQRRCRRFGTNAVQDLASGEIFLTGDLDLPSFSPKASRSRRLPGGVGPITDVWLIGNVLAAAAMSSQVEPRFGALITRRLLGR